MQNDTHPLVGHADRWDAAIADMAATAEEFRDAGWHTLELEPGDVTPVVDDTADDTDRVGFDVLVGDNEFADLTALIDDPDAAYDAVQIYKGQEGPVVFLLVTIEDPGREHVICLPLYYDAQEAAEMLAEADRRGSIGTYVRPLDRHETVTFSHDDPELFF